MSIPIPIPPETMDAVMNGTASMEFESDYYTFFSFVFGRLREMDARVGCRVILDHDPVA